MPAIKKYIEEENQVAQSKQKVLNNLKQQYFLFITPFIYIKEKTIRLSTLTVHRIKQIKTMF